MQLYGSGLDIWVVGNRVHVKCSCEAELVVDGRSDTSVTEIKEFEEVHYKCRSSTVH